MDSLSTHRTDTQVRHQNSRETNTFIHRRAFVRHASARRKHNHRTLGVVHKIAEVEIAVNLFTITCLPCIGSNHDEAKQKIVSKYMKFVICWMLIMFYEGKIR